MNEEGNFQRNCGSVSVCVCVGGGGEGRGGITW